MLKFIKYSLLTLFSLALIIILGTVLLLVFIDPNDYKEQIAKQFTKVTGRELSIDGKIQWSFFPSLGLQVFDVEISNAKGFEAKPFAKISEADVTVKVMPLFTGKIETGTIGLKNLTVNLAKNTNGTNNWNDLVNKLDDSDKTSTPSKSASNSENNTSNNGNNGQTSHKMELSISSVNINNAVLNWDNAKTNEQAKITMVNFNSKNINTLDESFPAKFKLTLSSKNIGLRGDLDFDGNITINNTLQHFKLENFTANSNIQTTNSNTVYKLQTKGNTALDLENETFHLRDFSLKLNNMNADGTFTAEKILSTPDYTGALKIPSFNLLDFLNSLGINIKMKNPKALTSARAELQIGSNHGSFTIPSLDATIDNSHITGKLQNQNGVPNLSLNIDKINFDNYTAKTGKPSQTTSNKKSVKNSSVNNDKAQKAQVASTNSPYAPLRDLHVRGNLNIGSMVVANMQASQAKLNLKAQNGVIVISPMTAMMYSGSYRGDIIINVNDKVPTFTANENLKGFQVKPLLKDLAGTERVSGVGNITGDVTTYGLTGQQILRNLNGKINLSLSNGDIKGLDILQQLDRAYSAFKKKTFDNVQYQSATSFTTITATAKIKNGVAYNKDLVLKSPLLSITGKGKLDLVTHAIDYHITVVTTSSALGDLGKHLKEIGNKISFRVTGTLENPKFEANLAEIAVQAVGKHLGVQLDRIGDTTDDSLDKAGKQLQKSLNKLFN